MNTNRKNPYGIKTPTTVEEFRENLRKYYVTETFDLDWDKIGDRGVVMNELSNENVSLTTNTMYPKPISETNGFSDVYSHFYENKLYEHFDKPMITPMVEMVKDVREYMRETNQIFSSNGYFFDESNFKIYTDSQEFIDSDSSKVWYGLDNQIWREFYIITLGKWSGYEFVSENKMSEEMEEVTE